MEFLADGLLNGTAMPMGTVEGVQKGDLLTFGGQDLRVEPAEENRRETTHIIRKDGALRVEFAFQPTGARLVLDLGEGPREVLLPELRARFVAALLTPPGGYEAGELIPDEVPRSCRGPDRQSAAGPTSTCSSTGPGRRSSRPASTPSAC